MNIYLLSLLISLGINLLFFLLASTLKTDKFTDFTYGLTFIFLTLFILLTNQTFFLYQVLIVSLIIIWAVRLISYLLIRILKIKKDSRFDDIRGDFFKFLKFWLFQALTVWVVMLPSIYLLSFDNPKGISTLMYLGGAVSILGLVIETISDLQKFRFRNNLKNKNKWVQSGLWKYSRHPNYFGEMLVWWGIFIFALPLFEGYYWLTILGPIFITFILLFVSGIPLLEKSYDSKFANNRKYQEYKRRTSILIPLPKKK